MHKASDAGNGVRVHEADEAEGPNSEVVGRAFSVGNTDYPRYQTRRRYGVKSDLTAIKSILSRALAQKGLDEKVERYEFILHWPEIVGETLAKISKPDYIARKVLLVTVAHSAWAQELTFLKPTLLRKLSLYLRKGDVVEDMVFRVGKL